MNKKDFWTCFACNITSFIILIEYFCGLEAAWICGLIWSCISLIIHLHIFRDYLCVAKPFIKH